MSHDKYYRLRSLLDARGTPYTEDHLHKLAFITDDATVAVVYDILIGKPVDHVLHDATERGLPPYLHEVMDIVKQNRFASSKEIIERHGVSASSASNRVSALERNGMLKKAFSYVADGGGRRFYYCRFEDQPERSDVEAFAKTLSGGSIYRIEKGVATQS